MPARHSTDAIPPFPIDLDREAFGSWLTGFTDGEGCFYLEVRNCTNFPSPFAQFSIKLRADDYATLALIRSYWHCGCLYHIQRNGSGTPTASYGVHDVASLATVVMPHFMRYPLRSRKARDFNVWSEAINLMALVFKRPKRGNGYPRWLEPEQLKFSRLCHYLREQRQLHLPVPQS